MKMKMILKIVFIELKKNILLKFMAVVLGMIFKVPLMLKIILIIMKIIIINHNKKIILGFLFLKVLNLWNTLYLLVAINKSEIRVVKGCESLGILQGFVLKDRFLLLMNVMKYLFNLYKLRKVILI